MNPLFVDMEERSLTVEKHPVPVKTKPSGEKTVSVQNLVGATIQLPESKYRNAEWDIQYALKAQERCRNCSGKKCTQPTPGYMPLVVYYAGTVREALSPCPYGEIQRREERNRQLLEQAGLPEMFLSCTFSEYQVEPGNRKALETVRKLAREKRPGRGFFLHGPSGVGKTMLAVLFAKELLAQGKAVRFTTVAGLLNQLRRNIQGDWNQRMDQYQEVPCLILDDLGTEKVTEWGLEQLFLLIDARYTARRQTVFTSNFSLQALQERFHRARNKTGWEERRTIDRLISRIGGMTVELEAKGRDHRWNPETLFPQAGETRNKPEIWELDPSLFA